MLALVLVGALVAQAMGAPTDCVEFCGDQGVSGNAGYSSGSRSSYSSYSKSGGYQRIGGSSLGGERSGRLENLDENVISGSTGSSGIGLNLDRPGNWQDEKHYVTDDGKGQMSYRAGQTVSGNGFSKFAEHSYSYGTHDSHSPLSNSQVLSTAEFNAELQNMRNRIASFMGSFHMGANSVVSANRLADFKNRASVISNQLSDVCSQVDVGSSMYQQMQQMQQQFQKDVEKLQQQMEQKLVYQSSSSSLVQQHSNGAAYHEYPTTSVKPVYVPTVNIAQIQQQQENLEQQRVIEEEISKVQQQVSTFYSTFNRADADSQYKTDFNNQADLISQKLTDIKLQAIQNEAMRTRIEQLRNQFETYLGQIRARIQQIEDRQIEEKKQQVEAELQAERERFEAYQRSIEAKKLQIQQEAENAKRQREEQIKREQEEARIRKLKEEAEKLKRQQEANQRHQEELERQAEEIRLQQQAEELRLQQQQLQLQQQQQQLQQQQVEEVQTQTVPSHVSGHLEVTGHSTYEHSIKTYGGGSSSSGASQRLSGYTTRPSINAHVDLTAVTSRLQQELNRLQNEINNFNTYTMRLTAANSQNVISEAESQAETLRQSINNLCETSGRYHNEMVHTSAEELQRRFDEMFRSFQNQAANYATQGGSGFAASAGYSSHSSYGSSGSMSQIRAPTITNVEYEHSKSAELEVSRRPVSSSSSSQRYVSGQQSVDCVELYAGQPCIEPQRRFRRDVSETPDVNEPYYDEDYDPYYDPTQQQQQHQPIFDDDSERISTSRSNSYQPGRIENPRPTPPSPHQELPQMTVGPKFGVISYGPKSDNPETERKIEDFTRRVGNYGLPNAERDYRPIDNEGADRPIPIQPNRRVEDTYYARQRNYEDLPRRRMDSPSEPEGMEIIHASDLQNNQRNVPEISEESTINFESRRPPGLAPYGSDNQGPSEKLQPPHPAAETITLQKNERLMPTTLSGQEGGDKRIESSAGQEDSRFGDYSDRNINEKKEEEEERRTKYAQSSSSAAEEDESRFYDNPEYRPRSELYDEDKDAQPTRGGSEERDRDYERVLKDYEIRRREMLERRRQQELARQSANQSARQNGDADSTRQQQQQQQVAVQTADFGSESQPGRQYSTQETHMPQTRPESVSENRNQYVGAGDYSGRQRTSQDSFRTQTASTLQENGKQFADVNGSTQQVNSGFESQLPEQRNEAQETSRIPQESQQTAERANFDSEDQSPRQQQPPTPNESEKGRQLENNVPSPNIPQYHKPEESTYNIQDVFGDNEESENASGNAPENKEREETTTPKPVSQDNREVEKSAERETTTPSGPHRGDLPGQSFPNEDSPVPPVVESPAVTEKPTTTSTTTTTTTTTTTQAPIVTEETATVRSSDISVRYNLTHRHDESAVKFNAQKTNDEWQRRITERERFSQSGQNVDEQQKYRVSGYDRFSQSGQRLDEQQRYRVSGREQFNQSGRNVDEQQRYRVSGRERFSQTGQNVDEQQRYRVNERARLSQTGKVLDNQEKYRVTGYDRFSQSGQKLDEQQRYRVSGRERFSQSGLGVTERQKYVNGGYNQMSQSAQNLNNQQKIQQNYRYTQHFKYNNRNQLGQQQSRLVTTDYPIRSSQIQQQGSSYKFNERQNTNMGIQQQTLKPSLFEQTSGFQFGRQNNFGRQIALIKPEELGHHQESTYKFQQHHKANIKLQQAVVQPQTFQQSSRYQFNGQSNFGQQIQKPIFSQSSRLTNFNAMQNSGLSSKNNFSESLPMSGSEANFTQSTFWKRVGHQKLSYSYNNSNEKMRENSKNLLFPCNLAC